MRRGLVGLAAILSVGCGSGYLDAGRSAESAGRYGEALACYDLAASRYGRSDDDSELEARHARVASAWVLEEAARAASVTSDKDAEVAFGRLTGVMARGKKLKAEPASMAAAARALDGLVDKLWARVDAEMKPTRYSRAIGLGEALVAELPEGSPARAKLAAARRTAAEHHLGRAQAAGEQHGAAHLHYALAHRFGAEYPAARAASAQALEELRAVSWTFELHGKPCEVLANAALRAFAPKRGLDATIVIDVQECRVGARRFDTKESQPWTEMVQEMRMDAKSVCTPARQYLSTSCSTSLAPGTARATRETCSPVYGNNPDCQLVYSPTFTEKAVKSFEPVTVHHVKYEASITASTLARWQESQSAGEIAYESTFDDTGYQPDHAPPKKFRYDDAAAFVRGASDNLTGQLENVASRVAFHRGRALLAQASGDGAEDAIVTATYLMRVVPPEAKAYFAEHYGLDEEEARALLVGNVPLKTPKLAFAYAPPPTGGCPPEAREAEADRERLGRRKDDTTHDGEWTVSAESFSVAAAGKSPESTAQAFTIGRRGLLGSSGKEGFVTDGAYRLRGGLDTAASVQVEAETEGGIGFRLGPAAFVMVGGVGADRATQVPFGFYVSGGGRVDLRLPGPWAASAGARLMLRTGDLVAHEIRGELRVVRVDSGAGEHDLSLTFRYTDYASGFARGLGGHVGYSF